MKPKKMNKKSKIRIVEAYNASNKRLATAASMDGPSSRKLIKYLVKEYGNCTIRLSKIRS